MKAENINNLSFEKICVVSQFFQVAPNLTRVIIFYIIFWPLQRVG